MAGQVQESALGGDWVKVFNASGEEIAEMTGEEPAVQRYFERLVGHPVEQLMEWDGHFEDPIRF